MSEIVFTTSAARKVYALMAEEDNFDLHFRAYISGGGCSGFQYGFTFDEKVDPEDTQVVTQVDSMGGVGSSERGQPDSVDVTLLIDPISYPYLSGAEIDYREDVQGAQFIIKNPNAKTTCGCGSSFSVADDKGEERGEGAEA